MCTLMKLIKIQNINLLKKKLDMIKNYNDDLNNKIGFPNYSI